LSLFRPIRKVIQFFVDKSLAPGVHIDNRYQIIKLLGSSSFGLVYKCKDLQKNQMVAVKQLRPTKQKFKKEVALFNREICMLEQLNHKALPKLLHSFSGNLGHFYVMEYIDGKNMEEVIFEEKRVYDEKAALEFIRALTEAVGYLHRHEIYHGDLRIPNIMLREEKPVIIDLGLAYWEKEDFVARNLSSILKSKKTQEERKQDDYHDLGDLLLFLLYTTFEKKHKKALPWTEELQLHRSTTNLLKRLLGIDVPYSSINEILEDIDVAIEKL